MTREIEVSIDGTVVAVGTYDFCAEALGYGRSTLVSYSASSYNSPLTVRKLEPQYRLNGEAKPLSEEAICRKTGWSKRRLQTRSSDGAYRYVSRSWHGNWAIEQEAFEELLAKKRRSMREEKKGQRNA